MTVVLALAMAECVAAAAQSIMDQTQIKDQTHLLAPALLIAGMAFSLKTLEGLNARIIGTKDSVWTREEMVYGVIIGLVGIVGIAMAVVNINDRPGAAPFIFWLVVPLICGVSGVNGSRRNMSQRYGIFVALGSMLVFC